MGSSLKGSTTQKTSQTSEPPAWAKPLLEKAAGSAQALFDSGQGYNVYRGPTVADFSPEKLEGLNNAMKMTGSTSAPITNEAMTGKGNAQVQQVQALINQQIAQQEAFKQAQAAAAAAAAAAVKPKQQATREQQQQRSGYVGESRGSRGY